METLNAEAPSQLTEGRRPVRTDSLQYKVRNSCWSEVSALEGSTAMLRKSLHTNVITFEVRSL